MDLMGCQVELHYPLHAKHGPVQAKHGIAHPEVEDWHMLICPATRGWRWLWVDRIRKCKLTVAAKTYVTKRTRYHYTVTH